MYICQYMQICKYINVHTPRLDCLPWKPTLGEISQAIKIAIDHGRSPPQVIHHLGMAWFGTRICTSQQSWNGQAVRAIHINTSTSLPSIVETAPENRWHRVALARSRATQADPCTSAACGIDLKGFYLIRQGFHGGNICSRIGHVVLVYININESMHGICIAMVCWLLAHVSATMHISKTDCNTEQMHTLYKLCRNVNVQ